MIHLKITYTIQEEVSLEYVHSIIKEFIVEINKNEPDTLLYKSYHEEDVPRMYYHIMTFKDEEAQEKHRNSPYCRDFVKKLYAICTEAPHLTNLISIE